METSLTGRALVFGPSGMGSTPVFPKSYLKYKHSILQLLI